MKRKKKKINNIVKIIVILLLVFGSFFVIKSIFDKKVNNNEKVNEPEINNDEEINNNDEEIEDNTPKSYDDVSVLRYYDEEFFSNKDENKDVKPFILKRLKEFSKLDKRINQIINNYDEYPEKLLMSLSMNRELTSFVLDYPNKKGKVYSDNIGSFSEKIPELFQWDERWGYGDYGTSNIAISGCGPTSLAMVIAALKKDNSITPYEVAKLAEEKGYYVENSGTTWDLIREGAKDYGLKVNELPLSESSMKNALNNNHYIICNLRKGDFTINGHYIVIAKVEDGKFKVNDPNSKERSSILWEFDRIKSQIKNLWEIYI